jgi:deoxyribodipyrimidine photo-lyase
MTTIERLADDLRVTVRRSGPPDASGRCVVYWMQRAQRGIDNPALDVAIRAGNALSLPVVAFLGVVPFYPHANRRHYRFLAEGLADIAASLRKRRVGFVLRHFPDHRLDAFCDQVVPALVIGDENPLREPERWRGEMADRLRVPLWTVDADVVVPGASFEKEQYAARTMRPRIQPLVATHLAETHEPTARVAWTPAPAPAGLLPSPEALDPMHVSDAAAPVSGMTGAQSICAGPARRVRVEPESSRPRWHQPAFAVPALRPHRAADGCPRRP